MSTHRNVDELLVAYLDNQLARSQRHELEQQLTREPELAARLAWLAGSNLPFKAAFQPLLDEAPIQRLQAELHVLLRPTPRRITRRQLIAAAIGLLAVGVAGDRAFLQLNQPEENWRSLVAQYMALYTPETLAGPPPSSQDLAAQLQQTGTQIGITLLPQQLVLPGATLKNARLLAYDGKRIAQLTYLDEQYGPLALCIIQQAGEASPENEQRLGMNLVYWSGSNHSFMLIGHNPPPQMNALASQLRQALAS
ncbi:MULTISPECIES: anti-sigma factor [unclassified Serratia (in: enterobacteria)]|uniref:anti-sigma factor family protein n=1 Tax=unclassified Serratia (in: enterobacteria) TaxID=2647522 RepID=UPI0004FF90FB|nr:MULTISPECIES: anti-sigma factor [unclassified Serratia (in: enterobacteria)]KFK92251.1 anti-sigma factor [Serratia sp. Ag2]KFK99351.1 anti-sigma factor [Serratia sp. Ag1]